MRKNDPNKNITAYFFQGKNKVEYVIFFLSLVLLLSVVFYLGYQWLSFPPDKPTIQVRWQPDQLPDDPGRYRLYINNQGGQTIEDVQIEATWWRQQRLMGRSYLLLDFSPRRSSRQAWFSFHHVPASNDSVAVRVISYQ